MCFQLQLCGKSFLYFGPDCGFTFFFSFMWIIFCKSFNFLVAYITENMLFAIFLAWWVWGCIWGMVVIFIYSRQSNNKLLNLIENLYNIKFMFCAIGKSLMYLSLESNTTTTTKSYWKGKKVFLKRRDEILKEIEKLGWYCSKTQTGQH